MGEVSESDSAPESAEVLISRLPDELWLSVLRHLTSLELCSVGLVCKSLLRLSRDPALWTDISLLGDAIASTETVQTLLR